jgi:GNAT superfamily N-acetyltransferase
MEEARRRVARIEVRAQRPDTEPGRRLLAEFEREIANRYPGWDPTRGPSATPADIGPPRGCFLVAYLDGEPAGCGALKRLDEEAAEIKRVYVAPPARGHGLARRLLAALEDAARERGYRLVRLDTGARLPEAVALFQSSGYVEIPDYNGNPYAAYWFEKRLDLPRS